MLLPWSLILLAHNIVLAVRPAKRFYQTHNYYVLQHDPHTGVELTDVAHALGVKVVEQAGELENHWLVRVEKPITDLNARSEERDPVLDEYNRLRRTQNLDRRSANLASSIPFLQRQTLRQRVKRAPPPIGPPPVSTSQAIADRMGIQDPLFTKQWHLVNDEFPEHSMNMTAVWEMGLTGKGVISSLVDDGLDYTSEDLKDNFDEFDSLSDDHHGTRCAGQVAAVKNTACGVGIAYDSKVAGVRILSGPISDVDEAASLNYGMQNGLGSIYVFASGNGASHGDHCNADGYTNSIYSVTVSAIDYKGLHPLLLRFTTDKGENACASTHGGTSAAAPNAVGVFALALEARPDLTWRDIQHLCVLTARQVNKDDPDWEPTALPGRMYSYKFGFGALDAYAYLKAAQSWKLVKPQVWFHTPTIQLDGGAMSTLEQYSGGKFIPKGGITSMMTVTPDMVKTANMDKLEHINVKVWIDHGKRGDVEVEIRSPSGIRSCVGGEEEQGENPIGDWNIKVSDQASDNFNGSFLGWNMVFWGSAVDSSKATALFEVPHDEDDVALPPHDSPRPSPTKSAATSTKQYAKPTAHLPGDHGTAPGENSNATFPDNAAVVSSAAPSASGTPTASSTPTADEGWFSDMSNLVRNQVWFFARERRRNDYASLPAGDELPMSGLGGRLSSGGARTKELYDAFGEVSDDEDEDADEETRLNARSGYQDVPRATSRSPETQYRDEPEESHRGSGAASPEGASDGSWEHAS
ncbi:peptidase S8/S53 domain-containing protein [Mycena amicta]|nr:peptidase S8/S53 domain-containing protein [Mycena amicta]